MSMLERPELCTSWVWLHPSYIDEGLWQNCLVAAYSADVKDPVGAAQKMYEARGGRYAVHKNRRKASRGKAVSQ
jgi:hypothetical protein